MRSVLAVLVLMLMISCTSDAVISETQALSGLWNKDEPVRFQFEQLDSLKTYNMFITIRHTNAYKYNNLFLISSLRYPHGKTVTDTLEFRLAQPDGQWIGTGLGSVKEMKLWYKEGIQFAEKGNYNITITHAVRNNGEVDGVKLLEGISDVGFAIEKAPKQ